MDLYGLKHLIDTSNNFDDDPSKKETKDCIVLRSVVYRRILGPVIREKNEGEDFFLNISRS